MMRKPHNEAELPFNWDTAILSQAPDRPHSRVARELANRAEQIRLWGRQLWGEAAVAGRLHRGKEAADELVRIRSENARLSKERDMLLTAVFSLLPDLSKMNGSSSGKRKAKAPA